MQYPFYIITKYFITPGWSLKNSTFKLDNW